MRVVLLYGRHYGEVVDLPYAVAKVQLEQGRALPEGASVASPSPVEHATATPPPVQEKKKRRWGR